MFFRSNRVRSTSFRLATGLIFGSHLRLYFLNFAAGAVQQISQIKERINKRGAIRRIFLFFSVGFIFKVEIYNFVLVYSSAIGCGIARSIVAVDAALVGLPLPVYLYSPHRSIHFFR